MSRYVSPAERTERIRSGYCPRCLGSVLWYGEARVFSRVSPVEICTFCQADEEHLSESGQPLQTPGMWPVK